MAGNIVYPPTPPTTPGGPPIWDVSGTGSQGFVDVVSQIALGSGKIVYLENGFLAWDVAGNGSLGFIDLMYQVN